MQESCERWGVMELAFPGRSDANPFTDYDMSVRFDGPDESVRIRGFYDGDGVWRVRFMPSGQGRYTYEAAGSFSGRAYRGAFTVTAPGPANHGPVRVKDRFHFACADGTPYAPVGTTCYAFALEGPETVETTFEELAKGYFNKLRFCILPKHYDFCLHDPVRFPYVGTPMDASVLTRQNFWQYGGAATGNSWDFTRFDPAFFRIYDRVLARLLDMGVQADIILFHPYDRWGFSRMSMEENLLYLRYVTARYGAFRNVWWAMANEYDLMTHLGQEDWETLARALRESDPYGHLASVHNCETFYDHSRPWITHCSCQRVDLHLTTELTDELRERYGKPVVWDEAGYEGDLPLCWGNLTAEELVRRAWEAAIRGGYCGHGETYFRADGPIWWAHGGPLHGQSPARFRFLAEFLRDVPGGGLKAGKLRDNVHFLFDDCVAVPEDPAYEGTYYFYYYSIWQPGSRPFWVDDDTWFDAEIIDTWNMTVTPAGRHRGRFELAMPGRQYMGVRLRKCQDQG